MGGHAHDSAAPGLEVGNALGDRACIRQSKLFRQYESGNAIKGLLGTANLQWDVNKQEGAYQGHSVWDARENAPLPQQPQHAQRSELTELMGVSTGKHRVERLSRCSCHSGVA